MSDTDNWYPTSRIPPSNDTTTSDTTQNWKSDSGEYECLVCGYQTDIENEHAETARHWCDGDCNQIRPFTRNNE